MIAPSDRILPKVSRETSQRISTFADLVTKWTSSVNLVARDSVEHLWHRHILDCAQLYWYAPNRFATWLDMGSGAGFPGLVIAIMADEMNPAASVTLIESDQRKAVFLRMAAAQLSLRVNVIDARIEEAPPQSAAVVSARALAPLGSLLLHVARHMSPDGLAILPKGRRAHEEIAFAREKWDFDVESDVSKTDSDATVLRLRNIYPKGVS